MANFYSDSFRADSDLNTSPGLIIPDTRKSQVPGHLRNLMSAARNDSDRLGKMSGRGGGSLATALNSISDSGVDDFTSSATGLPVTGEGGRVWTHRSDRGRFQIAFLDDGRKFYRVNTSDTNFSSRSSWSEVIPVMGQIINSMIGDKQISERVLKDNLITSSLFPTGTTSGMPDFREVISGQRFPAGSIPLSAFEEVPGSRRPPSVISFTREVTTESWPSWLSVEIPNDLKAIVMRLFVPLYFGRGGQESLAGIKFGFFDNEQPTQGEAAGVLEATLWNRIGGGNAGQRADHVGEGPERGGVGDPAGGGLTGRRGITAQEFQDAFDSLSPAAKDALNQGKASAELASALGLAGRATVSGSLRSDLGLAASPSNPDVSGGNFAEILQAGTQGNFEPFPSEFDDSDEYAWTVLHDDRTAIDFFSLDWATDKTSILDLIRGKYFRLEYPERPTRQGIEDRLIMHFELYR